MNTIYCFNTKVYNCWRNILHNYLFPLSRWLSWKGCLGWLLTGSYFELSPLCSSPCWNVDLHCSMENHLQLLLVRGWFRFRILREASGWLRSLLVPIWGTRIWRHMWRILVGFLRCDRPFQDVGNNSPALVLDETVCICHSPAFGQTNQFCNRCRHSWNCQQSPFWSEQGFGF